jgi:hypothetical protein
MFTQFTNDWWIRMQAPSRRRHASRPINFGVTISWRFWLLHGMMLTFPILACTGRDRQVVGKPALTETRLVGAVTALTRAGKAITVGVHATIVSGRRVPPDEAVIRAVFTSAQTMIRDSVTSPVTLSAAIAESRDVPVLTRYASFANPVPSYTIRRSHFTWVSVGDGIRLTNDQCIDHRQHFAPVPQTVGVYACVPVVLGWGSQEETP